MSDLPAWRQGDLPHAPTYNPVNLVRVIGPGAILLGLSLGAGDWLLGPAVAAAYGPSLLWVCTLSILFQGVLNTEMARYTLATGEPVFTGFMRQRPGPRAWAVIAMMGTCVPCVCSWARMAAVAANPSRIGI